MMDFLGREGSPLNETEWQEVTDAVIRVARRQLIGRRFLSLWGPMGPGLQVIETDRLPSLDLAQVTMVGDTDDAVADHRVYQRVPMIGKDFVVNWRDLEMSHTQGTHLDWSKAEAAASFLAQAEDHMIFHGLADQGLEGLLTVEGRHVLPTTGWHEAGRGFEDTVRAVGHLTSSGFVPPFAVVAGVEAYAAWHRLFGSSGVLEVDQIRKLVEGGVFVSPLIPQDTFLVVSLGSENMDLAVGLDVSVAFSESTQMNHVFRVLETLTLRIKRPASVCQILWQTE